MNIDLNCTDKETVQAFIKSFGPEYDDTGLYPDHPNDAIRALSWRARDARKQIKNLFDQKNATYERIAKLDEEIARLTPKCDDLVQAIATLVKAEGDGI